MGEAIKSWFNVGQIFVSFLGGIYRTVANIYELMLEFATLVSQNNSVMSAIENIMDQIYVLIAVFMLFRITVTMIEYLIDPDKVTDKSMGAGKLITRIVVSLALVIGFPLIMNNIVYPLQNALLQQDSFIYRLFSSNDYGSNLGSNEVVSNKSCLISAENFTGHSADATEGLKGCIMNNSILGVVKQIGNNRQHLPFEITYYTNKSSGDTSCTCKLYVWESKSNNSDSCSVKCPNYSSSQYYITNIAYENYETKVQSKLRGKLTISLTSDKNQAIGANGTTSRNTPGKVFAREIVASFANKPAEIINSEFLNSVEGDYALGKQVEENEITLDLFMATITGIILICVFAILCIEVLIREFKLALLQVLAPVAFISYINPNDKVLGNWFSKFIGCYLDLFIKILGIRIAVFFIGLFKSNLSASGIAVVLLYIGAFIFAKTVPNLISDIFGIKNMGGTFKESMNALKTAALAGTGALIGGAIGAASGAGKGYSFSTIAGGLVGGLGRGFMSGSKGHVLEGGMNQARRNVNVREAQANGSNWLDRQLAHAGINLTRDEDAQIKKYKDTAQRNQLAVDYADQAKSYVEGELNKGKGDQYADSQYMKKYRKAKEELARLEAVKNSITRESVAAGISHEGITDSMYNQIVDEQYKSSLAKANEEYDNQRNAFYGYTDKDGKPVKGLADLAIEEYYNNAEKDEVLAGMKKSNKIKMSTYSELADVDVDNWESVKNGKKTHKEKADEANAEAYKIENSDSYRAKKASQDANKK